MRSKASVPAIGLILPGIRRHFPPLINSTGRTGLTLNFGLTGDRNSVGYLKAITIQDTIDANTLQYQNRQVDIDKYRNIGAELRSLSDYQIGKMKHSLSAGIRYFKGKTDRLKNGKGTTGSDYDHSIDGDFPTDVDLTTENMAFFAENLFRINDKLLIVPGFRFEHLRTLADGRLSFNPDGSANRINRERRSRNFILFGIGTEYHTSISTEIYANFTQAYRPMLFSDLTASPTTDLIDPQPAGRPGYSIEAGYRGKMSNYLQFDAGLFCCNTTTASEPLQRKNRWKHLSIPDQWPTAGPQI